MNIENQVLGDKELPPMIAGERHLPLTRLFSHLFSYIFHPLFIPFYITYFLAFLHPSYFAGFSDFAKKRVLLMVTLNAIAFPAITVLLLKGLGFIDSIFLRTQKDRIIPYMASMIFFFWTQYVLREQNYVPRILVAFMFGVFISSSAALIANIYYKISMHAIGMGGLAGLFFGDYAAKYDADDLALVTCFSAGGTGLYITDDRK